MKHTRAFAPSPPPSPYREYEQQLRLGAARIVSLVFAVLLSLFIAGFTYFTLTGTRDQASVLTDGTLCVCVALFVTSVALARHQRLHLATAGTIGATNLTIITFMTFWAFSARHYFDAITLIQFASLTIAIVLAGALGAWWLVVATTVVVNGYSLWLIALIGQQTTLPPSIALFVLIAILQQWTVAALALTISGIYRRLLNDLGRAFAQAQQLDALKDQFITHVNHELRTPIMTLHGYVEFLQLAHATMTPREVTTALDNANRAGYNLITLLNSILDVRRIDVDNTDQPVDIVVVQQVLEEALRLIDPRDGTREHVTVRIAIDPSLAVLSDHIRLQQILTNLLSNALKYAPGAPIEVTAAPELERRQARHALLPWRITTSIDRVITIRVRDYGPGIPPEQIALLFNRFVRLPRDLASNVVGNGLGLYLCRVFALSMHGRVWVESSGVAGEGATFLLQLPAAEREVPLDKETTQPRLRSTS